jgi:hypothetical protein
MMIALALAITYNSRNGKKKNKDDHLFLLKARLGI